MTFARLFRFLLGLSPLALGFASRLDWGYAAAASGLACAAFALQLRLEADARPDPPVEAWEGVALSEMLAVGAVLLGLGAVAPLGFLVLLPFAAHRGKIGAAGARVGYVAGTLVLFAVWATSKGWVPTWLEWAQIGGIFAGAHLIGRLPGERVLVSVPAAFAHYLQNPSEPAPDRVAQDRVAPDRHEELKDTLRRLRVEHETLQRATTGSRLLQRLAEWRLLEDRTFAGLAKSIREELGVEGLAIYTVPDARDGVSLAGAAGANFARRTLAVPLQAAPIHMREAAERELHANRETTARAAVVSLLLDRGRLVGLAALFDGDLAANERARSALDAAAPFVSRMLADERDTQALRDRLKQYELLSRLQNRLVGETPARAAQALAEDIAEELKLDGCAVYDFTAATPKRLGGVGNEAGDAIGLPGGPGLRGWLAGGAPELVIDDAAEDARCETLGAIRRGIGMLVVQPLVSSGSLVGALVSWTRKPRGLSSLGLSTLRAIAPQLLRQVFGGFASGRPGLVDAETFWESSQGPGSFVEIDFGRVDREQETSEAREERRKLLAAALSRLPEGGLVTRRPGGTLLAFLAGFDEIAAERWAQTLRPFASPRWGMSAEVRGNSRQSSQFSGKLTA